MKTKEICFKKATVCLIVVSIFMLIGSLAYAAQECRLIQINAEKQGVGTKIDIEPKSITVPVGTCTVWINFIRSEQQVTVSFREHAKACTASTESSKEFGMFDLKAGESCYLSRPLALGESSSLTWTKPGEYKYTIQYAPKVPSGSANQVLGDVLSEGVIVVK